MGKCDVCIMHEDESATDKFVTFFKVIRHIQDSPMAYYVYRSNGRIRIHLSNKELKYKWKNRVVCSAQNKVYLNMSVNVSKYMVFNLSNDNFVYKIMKETLLFFDLFLAVVVFFPDLIDDPFHIGRKYFIIFCLCDRIHLFSLILFYIFPFFTVV